MKLTPAELALQQLRAIKALQEKCRDLGVDHSSADKVLCQLLRSLGYDEVVNEYELIDKWYA
jgi:hypothetical protein